MADLTNTTSPKKTKLPSPPYRGSGEFRACKSPKYGFSGNFGDFFHVFTPPHTPEKGCFRGISGKTGKFSGNFGEFRGKKRGCFGLF